MAGWKQEVTKCVLNVTPSWCCQWVHTKRRIFFLGTIVLIVTEIALLATMLRDEHVRLAAQRQQFLLARPSPS